VRYSIQFLRRVDEDLDIPASDGLIQISQDALEPVKIPLIRILDEDKIDIALQRLPPRGE